MKKSQIKGSVLIVEDNLINQMILQGILSKAGLDTTIAQNGKKALEQLENKHYDLILMDCQMPIMDGITATRMIRNQNKGSIETPIIAVTANTSSETRKACLDAGMNGFICKPVVPQNLLPLIEHWLNKQDARTLTNR